MSQQVVPELLDRFRGAQYHERAYVFVLEALEYCQRRLPERRHIDGRELAFACRDLALERYGLLARQVFEHWGVTGTADLGKLVFSLVDLGMLISQPSDSEDAFRDVYAFDVAFEAAYPWSAAHLA